MDYAYRLVTKGDRDWVHIRRAHMERCHLRSVYNITSAQSSQTWNPIELLIATVMQSTRILFQVDKLEETTNRRFVCRRWEN